MKNNCYQILGIKPTRDKVSIKRAYAAKAKEYHPEEQPEQFQQIRQAYEAAMLLCKEDVAPMSAEPHPVRTRPAAASSVVTEPTRQEEPEKMDLFRAAGYLELEIKERISRCETGYFNMNYRRDPAYWHSVIRMSHESGAFQEACGDQMLRFFVRNPYLPTSVWILISYHFRLPERKQDISNPDFELLQFVRQKLEAEKYEPTLRYLNMKTVEPQNENYIRALQSRASEIRTGSTLTRWHYLEFLESMKDIAEQDPECYLLLSCYLHTERNGSEFEKPALYYIKKAQELDKSNNRVRYYAACRHKNSGDLKYAAQLARTLYLTNYQDPYYVLLYAEVEAENGEYMLAARLFERVYEICIGEASGLFVPGAELLKNYGNDTGKIHELVLENSRKAVAVWAEQAGGSGAASYQAIYEALYSTDIDGMVSGMECNPEFGEDEFAALLFSLNRICGSMEEQRGDDALLGELLYETSKIIEEKQRKRFQELVRTNHLAGECVYLVFNRIIDLLTREETELETSLDLILIMEKNNLSDPALQEKAVALYKRLHRDEEGYQYCKKAQKSRYQINIHLYRWIGEVCYESGKYQEALENFRRYVELLEKELVFDGRAHAMLADCLKKIGGCDAEQIIFEREFSKAVSYAMCNQQSRKLFSK